MSHLLSLPLEIFSEVTVHLPRADIRTISLVSSAARQFVLPSLFRAVRLHRSSAKAIKGACDEINGAGIQIKHAIKRVVIAMQFLFNGGQVVLDGAPPVPVDVFCLLETFPNLSDLDFEDITARVRLQDLHFFASIARQTALRSLTFSLEYRSFATSSSMPTAGPEGLQFISMKWNVRDGRGMDDAGSSLRYLQEFLRPSLGTLTHLELEDYPVLGFQAWGPPNTSLRTFKYTTYSQSPTKVLEAVLEMFPNITHLEVVFRACVWTDGILKPLSSFQHLIHLKLSLDFEIAVYDSLDEDHNIAWYRRCFFRRFDAAKALAKVCPGLQRCEWRQLGIDSEGNDLDHNFVILEEAGNRVVKPVMQCWMAKHYEDSRGGPLPDDMVKENAY